MRRMPQINGKLVLVIAAAMLSGQGSIDSSEPQKGLWQGHFPNVTLITQDNKEVRFYKDLIKGKLALINFMYTTCDSDL